MMATFMPPRKTVLLLLTALSLFFTACKKDADQLSEEQQWLQTLCGSPATTQTADIYKTWSIAEARKNDTLITRTGSEKDFALKLFANGTYSDNDGSTGNWSFALQNSVPSLSITYANLPQGSITNTFTLRRISAGETEWMAAEGADQYTLLYRLQ